VEKNDDDIIFSRIRDIALKHAFRSERYKEFVRVQKYSNDVTFHHVFGSSTKLKSSDYLGVAVKFIPHLEGEENKNWIIEQMPEAIANLMKYADMLETENKILKNKTTKRQEEV